MSDYNGSYAKKKKGNALAEYKLRLQADCLDNAVVRNGVPQQPTLTVSVHDNQPRFTVYTNVEGDRQDGRIEGNMDANTFFAVMSAIKRFALDPNYNGGKPVYITNKGYFFGAEGKSDKPGVKSTTIVGLTSEGAVYIALVAKNRPNARFIFRPTEWHDMINSSGEPMSVAAVSSLYAEAYANMITNLVSEVLVDEYISWEEIKERKAQNANNRGKGGGNRGGGYSGGNRGGYSGNRGGGDGGQSTGGTAPKEDFDNDIPW